MLQGGVRGTSPSRWISNHGLFVGVSAFGVGIGGRDYPALFDLGKRGKIFSLSLSLSTERAGVVSSLTHCIYPICTTNKQQGAD